MGEPVGGAVERAVRVLRREIQIDSDALTVLGIASRVLLEHVPADVWCAVTLDPSTMLDTGGLHESGFPEDSMAQLFEIEHCDQSDVNHVRGLIRHRSNVTLLSDLTQGALNSSRYYREVLRPLGLGDELRLVLREGERVWGLLVWCRMAGSPPFTATDLRIAEALSGPVTSGLRRSLLLTGQDDGDVPDGRGLVLLGRDNQIRSQSPTAVRWLAEIQERRRSDTDQLPYALRALAARARITEDARIRIRSASGQWLLLSAFPLGEGDDHQVAVSVSPAGPGELMALVLDAYGLTSREQEVAQYVVLGRSTHQISTALKISRHTVDGHLKNVYAKVRVSSRGELVAKLFFEHYVPRFGVTSPLKDGRFAVGGG